MEKTKLLQLLKSEPNDIDVIVMILSNYTDYGHSEMGGMVSVKQFRKIAEVLLEWLESKPLLTSNNGLHKHGVNTCAICGSTDLFKFKLEHIKCKTCKAQFEHGC